MALACGGQSFEENAEGGRFEILGELEKHGTKIQFIEIQTIGDGFEYSSLMSAQFGKEGSPDLIQLASQTQQLTLPEIWTALSNERIPGRIAQYQDIEAWLLERESPEWIETVAPAPEPIINVEKALAWNDAATFLVAIPDFRQVNPLFVNTVNDGLNTTLSCTGQPGPRLNVFGKRFFAECNKFIKSGWVRIGIANISEKAIHQKVTPMYGPVNGRGDWQLMGAFDLEPADWTVWNWNTTHAKGLGFQTLSTVQLPQGPGDVRWYTAEVVPR